MAVYFITGKLGSGKTLCAVGRIREYLLQGRQVGTNLDLNLSAMFAPESRRTYIRLPDKPRLEDLEALGRGCVEENEARYGLIVLDELGTWFNTRNWQDKERLPVINWFLHARKLHWDVYFLVQSMSVIDGQLANSLAEHVVECRRTDRLSLPFAGTFLRALGVEKVLPKIHVAKIYYGHTNRIGVGRWIYRGKDLYAAYDTAQIFTEQWRIENGAMVDGRATFCPLPPYHENRIAYRNTLKDQITDIDHAIAARAAQQGGPRGMDRKTGVMILSTLVFMGFAIHSMAGAWETLGRERLGFDVAAAAAAKEAGKKHGAITQKVTEKQVTNNDNGVEIKNESDNLSALIRDAVISVPLRYVTEKGIEGLMLIDKAGVRYRMTFAEVRAFGWTIVEAENHLILLKSHERIDIAIGKRIIALGTGAVGSDGRPPGTGAG